MKQSFKLLCLFTFFLSSCTLCEDTSEPAANLVPYITEEYNYIQAINATGKIDMTLQTVSLPLNMNSDTCTYLFYGTNHTDTLSFKYRRAFDFESKQCGFTITLHSFEKLSTTTFDSVAFTILDYSTEFPINVNENDYQIEIFN